MNIHWKDWCWSWSSNPLATWFEERTHWKRLWCWERVKAGGEESNRGWDGWMASSTQWTWFVQTPEDSEGQESLVCCSSRSCKGLDTTERLNNSNQRVQMFSTTITSSTLVSSDQFLSRVWLFVTPWTAAHQPFLSITNFWSLLKLRSKLVMDREDWSAIVHGVKTVRHDWATELNCTVDSWNQKRTKVLKTKLVQWNKDLALISYAKIKTVNVLRIHLAQIAQEVRFWLDLRCVGTKADYKVSKVRKDSLGILERKRDLSENQACC